MDGHSSHMSDPVIEAFRRLNDEFEISVTVVITPPHTSHLMNVGDVSIFQAYQKNLRTGLMQLSKAFGRVPKVNDFATVAYGAFTKSCTLAAIRSGFRKVSSSTLLLSCLPLSHAHVSFVVGTVSEWPCAFFCESRVETFRSVHLGFSGLNPQPQQLRSLGARISRSP